MKRKKIWIRWIAWILLLVLCMNSAGTTALAVSANEESILNINGSLEEEMLSEEFISEEESTSSAEETPDYISHTDTRKGAMNSVYHYVRSYMLGRKARLVAKEAHRKTGRLLDIGTGTGYFADTMVRRGWKVEAVEKNPQAREFAKEHFGLEVKPESALQEFAPGSFDVITLWHVMEHLEHLGEVWQQLHEMLTEKGLLIVAVPNCSSYDAQRYGEYWAAYDVPRHLWHFTPGTIQQLASRHGFIMAARHPMPFDAFYVSMLSEKHRGSSCSFLKGMYVGTLAWFSALGRKERSSSMIYVFRKKR